MKFTFNNTPHFLLDLKDLPKPNGRFTNMMINSKMSTKQMDSLPHQNTDNFTQHSHNFSFTDSITIATHNIKGATNLSKIAKLD